MFNIYHVVCGACQVREELLGLWGSQDTADLLEHVASLDPMGSRVNEEIQVSF